MGKLLFTQQQAIFDQAVAAIQEGQNYILISGPSGCGKTFLSNRLCTWITERFYAGTTTTKSIRFLGDNRCSEREYHPILSALNSLNERYEFTKTMKTGITKTASFSPLGGSFFEFVAEAILNRNGTANYKLNQIFNETEIDIILKLRNALHQHVKAIYMDNLHWWDTKSIEFFYLLLQNKDEFLPGLNDVIFILNVTTNQISQHEEQTVAFLESLPLLRLAFIPFQYTEYCQALREIGLVTPEFNPKILKLLFAISEGHLEVTLKALTFQIPFEATLDAEILTTQEGEYIRLLLERRLSALGATGQQIDDVLKFGSLLGLSFTFLELEYITKSRQPELRSIIKHANSISLVETSQTDCQFSHEIIREFFRQKALEQKEGFYYDHLIQCYQALYPTEYSLRIHYLLCIGNIAEIEKLYCLDQIRQLESGIASPNQELEVLLSEETREYIYKMSQAWAAYKIMDYGQVRNHLRQLEDIYPVELLAERDYLIALSLTRSLVKEECDHAFQLLSAYETIRDRFQEPQIWSKTMLLLFAVFLHAGRREDCRRIHKMLYSFYSEVASVCETYQHDLNVLRRKSIAIYELEISCYYLQKSVRYFQPHTVGDVPEYPREYFMSLVNYNSSLLCLGKFTDAYEAIQKAMTLIHEMPEIAFPRTETMYNNFLLACYFTGQLQPYEIVPLYQSLLQDLPATADRTIIQTNLAIFYIQTWNLESAERLLTEMRDHLLKSEAYEPSRLYHIEANLVALYLYKKDWTLAAYHLKPLDILIPNIDRNSYYTKKHTILKRIIQEQISFSDNPESIIQEVCPAFQTSAWNFFGRLFAYNTLEYWSEA